MPVKDIASNVNGVKVLPLTQITSETVATGTPIDTADFGEGVAFFLNLIAKPGDADFRLGAQESDEPGSGFVDVIPEKIIGAALATAVIAIGAPMQKIGVFSTKRYVRPTVVAVKANPGDDVDGTVEVFAVANAEYQPV